MKLAAVESIKFKKLKMKLSIPHWQAVGLLETLWMFTARNAPLGDIGRHTNEDIAVHLEWLGDPNTLIQALIDCRWLDEDEEHRLLVHDWADHLPDWLKGNLSKHKKTPITRNSAKQPKSGGGQPAIATCPEQPPMEATSSLLTSSLLIASDTPSSDWAELPGGTAEGDASTFRTPVEGLAEWIYATYPKKTDRGLLNVATGRAVDFVMTAKGCTDEQARAWIKCAVFEFASSPMGKQSPIDKIPSPARWLDNQKFLDDRKVWQKPFGDSKQIVIGSGQVAEGDGNRF